MGTEETTSPTGFLIRDLNLNVDTFLGATLPAGAQDPFADYDVVHINGDTLYLSFLPSLEESSRPDDVDSNFEYVRQM